MMLRCLVMTLEYTGTNTFTVCVSTFIAYKNEQSTYVSVYVTRVL